MNTLHPGTLVEEDVMRVFDELAEEILNVSDRIFPLASPVNNSQTTFTLSERALTPYAGSDSIPDELIICPKARLRDSTTEKPKVFECRCCCVGEPHADTLTYKPQMVSYGGEAGNARAGHYYKELDAASKNICPQGISPKRVFGMTVWPGMVHMIQKICHETNPLGRLVVTLQNTMVPHAIVRGQEGAEDDVEFYFDLREDAQQFTAYLEAGQDRLREFFIRGLMENEQVVRLRLLDSDSSPREDAESWRESVISSKGYSQAIMTLKLVSSHEGGDQSCRAIVSRERYENAICINFKDKMPQISQRGLLKSLQDLEIWISDYDQSGKSIVSRMSWEELTLRGTKPRSLRATFIKRTMRGERKDSYERVKIAIIDSGLHDRERGRYRAEYKDFTGVPNNDSWHGTCCAGIVQGVYEEARLYIARIFERDHADKIEGPLRMAKAIHWAIEPPRSVDIISISAGFRNYSKELDEAVTKAKAAGVLVIAAASNWQNTNTVAFPARHNLSTMCIYSTNTGNQSSSFNPEPRVDTQNFAILGEGFQHPDQRRNERMSGTSMATAVAAGLAARIIDFSRQKDNKASIFRAQDVGKLPGMLSIFSTISKPAGNLRYISPLELLPLRHGVSREADRQRVREVLSQAMERAN
ncbi:uncharacterized protein FSUBG_5988 [Fusarium subglutinans]|uniref:Peptidase S8/S53 domain-containing protein n=1 Tax=Gibberella subglutinans TaxID=42677 RepID=A0A8H5V362_GIBSU|nr:uncharacterized protein FSUBG_5988 [Fusarium subglutinans]KAF5606589.1 hypothetical protein FSUBG_5988 [Fusarium subglutinans]